MHETKFLVNWNRQISSDPPDSDLNYYRCNYSFVKIAKTHDMAQVIDKKMSVKI